MAHDHGPPHSTKQPDRGWLVAFIIFTRTHPTYYDLESSAMSTTNMETNGNCDVFSYPMRSGCREKSVHLRPADVSTTKWVWRFT